ncbi:MAG: peptidylprolyl isomerase [Ignavibacterium sp.]|nr:peptidylprolyl isomerase [Ignavibacterium sp.]MDW8375281.1 peptidylprolyl isomerase [Ignavibacteriales bacterium]
MTISRKLSGLKADYLLIIIFIFFQNCSEEKIDQEFLARVNDSYLTREDIASLIDTSNTEVSEINFLIKDWVKKELLFQKAIEEGLTDEKTYEDILLKSSRELAIALLIKKKFENFEIDFNDQDLINFYNDNKSLYQNSNQTYQLNIATFSDEDLAIKFRDLAIESNWQKAVQFTSGKKELKSVQTNFIAEEKDIYPNEIARLANGMHENEISILIKDLKNNFYVFQLVKVFKPFEIYPFELVKDLVKENYIASKKLELFESFLSELYSNNKIEVKEWTRK